MYIIYIYMYICIYIIYMYIFILASVCIIDLYTYIFCFVLMHAYFYVYTVYTGILINIYAHCLQLKFRLNFFFLRSIVTVFFMPLTYIYTYALSQTQQHC